MKHIALAKAAVLGIALAAAGTSCRTYNTYVEVPPTPTKTTTVVTRPAPTPTKSASISGGSAEGFQAVTKPSSYSN